MVRFMRSFLLLLWISVQENFSVRKFARNASRSVLQMRAENIESSGMESYNAENEIISVESMCSEYQPGQSSSKTIDSQLSDESDESVSIMPKSSKKKQTFQTNIPGWKIYQEMEKKVAKQLGTNRTRIYRLKRELKGKQFLSEIDEQNQKLIKKFDRIRDEAAKQLPPGIDFHRYYSKNKNFKLVNTFMEMKEEYLARTGPETAKLCQEIDKEIAQKLGKTANAIYSLKKRMGLTERCTRRFATREQKKILRECAKMRKENPDVNDGDCAAKFGIHRHTIGQWRRRHGFPGGKNIYTIPQKKQFLRQYWQIKLKHPEMLDLHIAKMLKITKKDLANWKYVFGKMETDEEESMEIENLQPVPMALPDVTRSSDPDNQKIWSWNSTTRQRQLLTRPRRPISFLRFKNTDKIVP